MAAAGPSCCPSPLSRKMSSRSSARRRSRSQPSRRRQRGRPAQGPPRRGRSTVADAGGARGAQSRDVAAVALAGAALAESWASVRRDCRPQRGPSRPTTISSSASQASAAPAGRASGCFASMRSTHSDNAGSRPGVTSRGEGTGSFTMLEEDAERDVRVTERNLSGQELVGDDPERIEVGPRPDRSGHRLLRRHVLGRPTVVPVAQAGRSGGAERLGDAEVRDLDAPSFVSSTFSGLRSRWTTFCVSAWASPARRPSSTPPTCGSVDGPDVGAERSALEVLHRDEGHRPARCSRDLTMFGSLSGPPEPRLAENRSASAASAVENVASSFSATSGPGRADGRDRRWPSPPRASSRMIS